MNVPALMYHEIKPDGAALEKYAVSLSRFASQMRRLRDLGLRSLSVPEFVAGEGGADRAVMITFDDGYTSNHRLALPVLEELGLTATVFVATAFIGREGRWMTRDQIRDMSGRGLSVQSHSHSHPFMSDLAPEALNDELTTSRSILEEITRDEVSAFSCPGGRVDRRVLTAAGRAGYTAVCTSRPTGNRPPKTAAPVAVHRCLVGSETTLETFEGIVGLRARTLAPLLLRHLATGLPKRLLGNRLYHRLWRRLH